MLILEALPCSHVYLKLGIDNTNINYLCVASYRIIIKYRFTYSPIAKLVVAFMKKGRQQFLKQVRVFLDMENMRFL